MIGWFDAELFDIPLLILLGPLLLILLAGGCVAAKRRK